MASDQKVKDLEQKLDISKVANEELRSKLEALEAQNLQLDS